MAPEHGGNEPHSPTGGTEPPARDSGLDDRLRKLDEALATRRAQEDRGSKADDRASRTGWGNALRMSSEFIAGVVVGAALGWAIDYWAGTTPWGLIVFLLLGFGAGVLNVLRATGEVAEFGRSAQNGDGPGRE